jgi:hypothetical protein
VTDRQVHVVATREQGPYASRAEMDMPADAVADWVEKVEAAAADHARATGTDYTPWTVQTLDRCPPTCPSQLATGD